MRTVDTAARDARACELRARGCSLQRIADELGYSDRSAARKAVERALDGTVAEDADVLRRLELARLDRLHCEALAVLETEHVIVSQGRIVRDDQGKAIPDDAPVLAAIDRLLKVSDRRAKLLGLDAPARIRATVITEDMIDAELERLTRVLAELEGREPAAGEDGVVIGARPQAAAWAVRALVDRTDEPRQREYFAAVAERWETGRELPETDWHNDGGDDVGS